jgi:hypothetical protein
MSLDDAAEIAFDNCAALRQKRRKLTVDGNFTENMKNRFTENGGSD